MCWLTVRLDEAANRLAKRPSERISYLQVTELEGRRRLGNDLRGLFESSRGFLFALCSNNLKERVKKRAYSSKGCTLGQNSQFVQNLENKPKANFFSMTIVDHEQKCLKFNCHLEDTYAHLEK